MKCYGKKGIKEVATGCDIVFDTQYGRTSSEGVVTFLVKLTEVPRLTEVIAQSSWTNLVFNIPDTYTGGVETQVRPLSYTRGKFAIMYYKVGEGVKLGTVEYPVFQE